MFKRLSITPIFLLSVIGLALAAACSPSPSFSQDRNFRTINVSGTGIVYGSPDIATADISVVTRNEAVQPASDENTTQMQAVIAALRAQGVADEDIRTSNYVIMIDQPINPDGTPTGTREYVITNTITVTFRDLSTVGEGLEAAIESGANQVANIVFTIEDNASLSAEARAKAMTDAQTRAQQMAEAAGVEIDAPYSISESFIYMPLSRSVELGIGGGAADVAQAAVPVQTGQIAVQVDVNVTYLIR